VAIVTSAGVTAVLTLFLDFQRLVDLAALAVLLQYLATAAALVRIGSGRTRFIGLVACVAAALFGAQSIGAPSTPVELGWLGALTAVGVLIAALSRWLSRRSSPTAA
jgi:amino acid transporter